MLANWISIERQVNKLLFTRAKSFFALCGLLLLQACTSPPKAITYLDRIKLVGGSAPQAEEIALFECGKLNPFFFNINLVNEHANIHGRVRDYKCQFWESTDDLTRPTSLEQKVLQTRKFSNSPKEIEKALNAWAAHKGGRGGAQPDFYTMVENGNVVGSQGGTLQIQFGKPSFNPILIISGRYVAVDKTSVHLRIRTFTSDTNVEVFSPKLYQLLFNQIAQELFTEAIKLEPIEMK